MLALVADWPMWAKILLAIGGAFVYFSGIVFAFMAATGVKW